MFTEDKLRRKVWSVAETGGFLKCYAARKKEFVHIRKKRDAYSRVLEDMISQGFTDSSTTVLALESKMRTVFSAYKSAKETETVAPCIAQYMDILEEIFGTSALIANDHTLSLGISRAQALPVKSLRVPLPQQPASPQPVSSPQPPSSPPSASSLKSELLARSSPLPRPASYKLPQSSSENDFPKKPARENYYREKLKLKRKVCKKNIEEKKRFHDSVIALIKDIELKKLEAFKDSFKF